MKLFQLLIKASLIMVLFQPMLAQADIAKAQQAFEKEDFDLAAEEYLKEAELGNVEAQAQIGAMYFWGRGVRRNEVEAYAWSIKAAKKEHKVAQHTIGYFFQNGIYINKDIYSAIDWYQRAADQGYPPSIANLAGIYLWGEEMPQDMPRAINMAKLAAEKGDAYGQYLYAYIFQTEYNDSYHAVDWYIKSTINGYAAAANQIGSIYYYGTGLEKDLKKAYYWFYIAEEKGSPEAIGNREKIARDIKFEDLQQAENDAKDWLEKTGGNKPANKITQ